MKKSPIKKTPQKSRSVSKSKLSTSNVALHHTLAGSSLYFCHYKNAMYMGGIKSFKKDGRGILLHDNGQSVITSYSNDLLHGHNIFFDNYALLSANYNKNKLVELAYRCEGFLVYLNYNNDKQLEGKTILLNYITKTIIYCKFKRGNMIDKTEETDYSIINRVFQLGQIDFLIGRTHAKIIKYEFDKIPFIQAQKQGNRIIIGFEKFGFINGLGFSLIFRGAQGGYNPDSNRNEDQFQLKLVERGYYINTQLNGMGQKVFKNGNRYVGQFKDNVFQGNGILKNNEKKNWVSGYFKDGNLVELLQYNSEGQIKKYDKIVEALHERKTNWINNEILTVDFNIFVDQIQKIITTAPNTTVKSLEQRKQEVLKKIQEKFMSETNTTFQNQISQQSLNQLKNGKNSGNQSSVKKFINNFIPNDSNTKKILFSSQQEGSAITFQANSPQKNNNPNQNKIFDRSPSVNKLTNYQNYLERSHSKKQLSHSPGLIKSKDLSSSRKNYSIPSLDPPIKQKQKDSFGNKYQRRVQPQVQSIGNLQSTQRVSGENRAVLDSKRMVGKNTIFKYLQNQQKQSPQFTYSKMDTIRQQQIRQRLKATER